MRFDDSFRDIGRTLQQSLRRAQGGLS